ncbi:hypothetical protein QJQ45_010856 [Haematococcus lacustris]|nr:hypothetical protein QJQ45_010856 [Haematococcus lacustris]
MPLQVLILHKASKRGRKTDATNENRAVASTGQAPLPAPGSSQRNWHLPGGQLKHITVTLATWDAVWEVYLDPEWAQQRLRLYGTQNRALEQFFRV